MCTISSHALVAMLLVMHIINFNGVQNLMQLKLSTQLIMLRVLLIHCCILIYSCLDQTSDDPSFQGNSQAAPSAAEPGVKHSPPSTPGSSAMEPSQESRGPTSDRGKTIQHPAPTQETPPSTEPTQPGVLNTGLARMHIDDVRKHGRKRDFDGDEGDDKQSSTSIGSNQNSTYAATAARHSSGEKPPAQSSVPPNKKPKNSGSSKESDSHASTGKEDQNTHPPDSNIQSVKEQVCALSV